MTVVEDRHNVRKILSPSSSVLLLAKTITYPAARFLCNSWASCCTLNFRYCACKHHACIRELLSLPTVALCYSATWCSLLSVATGFFRANSMMSTMMMMYTDSSLRPSSLKVTEIAAQTAVVSWVPASSNLDHAVSVDGEMPTIIRRTCFICHIAGAHADSYQHGFFCLSHLFLLVLFTIF